MSIKPKRRRKGIVVFGGGELLTSLLNLNRLDEISLAIIPVILGKGISFVKKSTKKYRLHLLIQKHIPMEQFNLTYNVNK